MNNMKIDSGKEAHVKSALTGKTTPANAVVPPETSLQVAALQKHATESALKRKKRLANDDANSVEERDAAPQSNTESSVVSDMVVAQAESGLSGGAGLGSSAGAAGATGASSAGLSAAGSASGAAGSASVSGSLAATT